MFFCFVLAEKLEELIWKLREELEDGPQSGEPQVAFYTSKYYKITVSRHNISAFGESSGLESGGSANKMCHKSLSTLSDFWEHKAFENGEYSFIICVFVEWFPPYDKSTNLLADEGIDMDEGVLFEGDVFGYRIAYSIFLLDGTDMKSFEGKFFFSLSF